MQFNSIPFLFYFLPLFVAVYYLVPKSWRGLVLSLGSLLFYWEAAGRQWWCPVLLVGMTLAVYGFGWGIARFPGKWPLAGLVVFPAAVLAFFKLYQGGALLPVGLSFYSFQMIAYLADVYRRRILPERNLLAFCAQTWMFPKLLSGPLTAPAALGSQGQETSLPQFHRGLQELILGLSLKVLLADRVGGLWSQAGVVGYESISTPYAWLALLSFAMRLYFDFYGYSLMAVGLGRMLGYTLPMNFLEPYSARSVGEFYRRWHATLGQWFREYVYIPLGGSRKGTLPMLRNMGIVWLLTGLWHGVNGGYLLWAGFLYFLMVNERLWLGEFLEKSRVWSRIYTVAAILLSWVPFAAGSGHATLVLLGRMFGLSAGLGSGTDYLAWGREYGPLLALGVLFATPLPKKLWEKVGDLPITDVALFLLLWITVYFIATSAQDPFLYFQY